MGNLYETYNLPFGLSLAPPPPRTPPVTQDLLSFDNSGTIQTARYINPLTQDFALSSDNLYQGMNAVEQEVQLAILTTFNSSSVLNFGQNFGSIKVITPYITKQMTNLLNQCLSYQITNNLITIYNVSVTSNPQGQCFISFSFTNNTLGTQTEVVYLIPGT